jgi:hypothetical protein
VQNSHEFAGAVQGYVINGMKANYFRVSRTLSREDYMQEAYLVFLRVVRKYEGTVTEPKHMMALFKQAWANELNDLATRDTQQRMFVQAPLSRDDGGEDVEAFEPAGDCDNDGALATMLRQAPREVSMVLNLFLSAPQEVLDVALASWRGKDRRCRTGGSQRICHLLGIDPSVDVMQRVEDYFAPQPR